MKKPALSIIILILTSGTLLAIPVDKIMEFKVVCEKEYHQKTGKKFTTEIEASIYTSLIMYNTMTSSKRYDNESDFGYRMRLDLHKNQALENIQKDVGIFCPGALKDLIKNQ